MRQLIKDLIATSKESMSPTVRRKIGSTYRRLRRYFKTMPNEAFLDALNTQTVKPDLVLYESFYGRSMSCSPRTIFEGLLDAPQGKGLHHVWVVKEIELAPAALLKRSDVAFVVPGTPAYGDMLATAGTIIINSTLPTWYMRRDGQNLVNTWHGVPLKQMFKDESAQHPTVHRNSQRNFLQATHLLLPNPFTTEKLLETSDVGAAIYPRAQSLGAPRVDETLNADRHALRKKLGVKPDQKLVFVAPTWRGILGSSEKHAPMLDVLFAKLNMLNPDQYAIYGQLHNFVGTEVTAVNPIPAGMSTNRFMAAADVLITDYSSIMFDFFPTGRQVILYVYDRHQYEELRGTYCDLEDLPVQICYRPDEVISALNAPQNARDMPQYDSAKAQFFPLEDGQATGRAIAAIFNDGKPVPAAPRPTDRPRVLFFGGGWQNNGITTSFLNLLKALADYDMDIFVATEGLGIERSPEKLVNIAKVHPGIHLLHRAGPMPDTKHDSAMLEKFYVRNAFVDDAHEAVVRNIFVREGRRLFGDMTFDAAIDFSGYSRFWAPVIANVPAKKHAIFQHNDLFSEADNPDKRHDALNGLFAIYKWYDKIISVSEETRQVNQKNLGHTYPGPDASLAVRNMIVPDRIRAQAAKPLPRGLKLRDDIPLFVMAGRLSPEKAVDRAIDALAQLRKEGLEAGLVIMGTGILEDDLKAHAKAAGVGDLVKFAGHVSNPFPVIARGDCFLLSSDYEGQPMVLLEALTLGKPIVATNIPGSRSVLGQDYGHMVPQDVAGVADGMRRFLKGEIAATATFDADDYCADALQEFFDNALGFTPQRRKDA